MRLLIFIYSISIFAFVSCETIEGELLEIPTTVFRIGKNLKEGDVIVGDQFIRAIKNIDESVNIQLEETANPSPIAINNSIIVGGEPIRFILVNKNALENKSTKLKLQAIGVITGKAQDQQLIFEIETSSELPEISKTPEQFILKNDFQEKETAVLKTSFDIPIGSEVEILGKYSERIRPRYDANIIELETVPCSDSESCGVQFPFSLLLVLKNGENHIETIVTFDEEKKHTLKMNQKVYDTTIEENTGEQERLLKITAIGNSSDVIYSLRDASGLFSIHPKEGILTILHPEFLTISSFSDNVNLTAIATDGENTANAIIRVKIAEKIEKPIVFGFVKDLYELEAQNVDRIVGNIAGNTPQNDIRLIYRITEGRSDLYEVKPNGNVEYIGDLDKGDRFDRLRVAVQDETSGLKIASTEVHINLKGIGSFPVTTLDDEEKLEIISADDEEGVVIDSIQFEDKDVDGKLEYEIGTDESLDENGNVVDEDGSRYFDVKSGDDNQAHLIIKESLKTSNISTIRIDITAHDVTHPKEPKTTISRTIVIERKKERNEIVGVNLINLPDNISFPTSSPIGSFVYQVTVLPLVDNITFSIEPEHLFEISSNGKITTKVSLENEKSNIPFRVTVSKNSENEKAESVLIPQKKTKSHFLEQEYSINLPRIAPPSTVVALVSAVNSDGEQVTNDFSLRGGHSQFFTIDSQGTIKTKSEFSKDGMKDFDFLVALTSDLTITAPVHVKLDEVRKDSVQLVENQIFATVFDNLPIHSYLAKVETVVDDEDVKFTMSSDEKLVSNLFFIDDDGTIRSSDYLTGAQGMHKFSVLVSSIDQAGVRSTSCTVIIDILKSNECVPKFKHDENLIFYVRENSPKGTLIGRVSAEPIESKCGLSYSLWDPISKKTLRENELVSIDEATGELKTAKEFDYKKQKSYVTMVQLSAGRHHVSTMSVELKVMDVDNNPIHFDLNTETVEVPEDSPITTVIATVKAVEVDEQPVFYHLGSSSPPEFSLHSTTGKVTIEQPLDRERVQDYVVEIGASNKADIPQSEWPTSMKLYIKVKDVNDNGPIFDKLHYDTIIDKDTVVGHKLIEVHAVDPDSEDDGKKLEYSVAGTSFEYRGMSRSVDDVIDINSSDGIVYTVQSLKDYVGGVFHVQLQVRNVIDGTLGKSGLKVYVHDKSDVLAVELPYSPPMVTPVIVEDFTRQISNSTTLSVLPKAILYKSSHGITSQNSVDLQLIFFNKTSSEILPAEKVLAICGKSTLIRGMPELRKIVPQAEMLTTKKAEPMIQPELLLILISFLVLLAITLALCGLLMCYHRNRFQRTKTAAENDAAIKEAINFPPAVNRSPALISFKHYPSPAPEMHRPIPNGNDHVYRSPTIDEKVASYAVQQATITVAEHEEKI